MSDENIFDISEGTEFEDIGKFEKNKLINKLEMNEENNIFKDGNQPYREELKISKKHIEYIEKKRELD